MLQKTIEITNGPSREELFDGLRLCKSTRFNFKTEFKEWRVQVFVHGIDHIQRRRDWLVKFSMTISPVIHFGSTKNEKAKIHSVVCNYSTETRKGQIFIE